MKIFAKEARRLRLVQSWHAVPGLLFIAWLLLICTQVVSHGLQWYLLDYQHGGRFTAGPLQAPAEDAMLVIPHALVFLLEL